LRGQPLRGELLDRLVVDRRQEAVELGRRVEARDRRGLLRRQGRRDEDEDEKSRRPLQERAPGERGKASGVGGAGSGAARRFRARRMTTIIVPAIAKGTAIISRIDQYMPLHIDVWPGLSESEVASLQSGHAAASAGARTATRRTAAAR